LCWYDKYTAKLRVVELN